MAMELPALSWHSKSGCGGVPGKKRFIKDLHGEAVRDFGLIEEPRPGKALALSLDLRLQYAQHRELQRAMRETGAAAGSAVTLDAWTGEGTGGQ
jgi:cell division protein FtsI (penicillin-binding protein 3)